MSTVAALAIGYLIGTIPTADLVTRVVTRGSVDIRREGSGNPGGLNAIRVVGKRWGVFVVVVDVVKGATAGLVGHAVAGDGGAYCAATAAITGHCYPVWTRFRGGRGVATAGGTFATAFPPFFVLGGVVAGSVALVSHRARLAVRVACGAWIAAAVVWWTSDLDTWWGPAPDVGLVLYSAVGAAVVLSRFRGDRTRAHAGG
jgi:acyl phosphate:glycerol-3-phosphate acyltransferase